MSRPDCKDYESCSGSIEKARMHAQNLDTCMRKDLESLGKKFPGHTFYVSNVCRFIRTTSSKAWEESERDTGEVWLCSKAMGNFFLLTDKPGTYEGIFQAKEKLFKEIRTMLNE